MNDTIGIDISKEKMDAYWLSNRQHRQFCNDQKGVNSLAFWAREAGVARAIFESTGVYHRRVKTGLAEHAISFARVNPRQAKLFLSVHDQVQTVFRPRRHKLSAPAYRQSRSDAHSIWDDITCELKAA